MTRIEQRNGPSHPGRATWQRMAGPALLALIGITAATALLAGVPWLAGVTVALVVAWVVFTVWEWASGRLFESSTAFSPAPVADGAARVELPTASAFGPEGPRVARFLHALAALSPGQWREVARALEAMPRGAAGSELREMKELADAWHTAGLTPAERDRLSAANAAVDDAVDQMVARRAVPAGPVAHAAKLCATAMVIRPYLPDGVAARVAAPFAAVLPRGVLD